MLMQMYFLGLKPIFEEFRSSNKDIFITEHGYHKNHDKTNQSGKFCVRFQLLKTIKTKK